MTNKVHISQIDDKQLINSTTVLGAGVILVGDVHQVSGFTHITGFAYSDVGSGVNGLIIEQAMRESDLPSAIIATTDITHSITTITGGDILNNAFSVQIVAPFARIIYTNGAAPQTTFKIYFEARILRGL